MVLKHSADQVILQFWIAMNVQLSSCLPFILHFMRKLFIQMSPEIMPKMKLLSYYNQLEET